MYQKKGETGKDVDGKHEILLDIEAAEAAWPDFKIFYKTFKDHLSLGPGSVRLHCSMSKDTHNSCKQGRNKIVTFISR